MSNSILSLFSGLGRSNTDQHKFNLPDEVVTDINSGRSKTSEILLITIRDYTNFNSMYGSEFVSGLCEELQDCIKEFTTNYLPGCECALNSITPGEYMLIWDSVCQNEYSLPDLAYSFEIQARSALKRTTLHWTGVGVELGVGYATIRNCKSDPRNRKLTEAITRARHIAESPLDMAKLQVARDFEDIVQNGRIRVHYQPIMDFRRGDFIGWEALSRGPRESRYEPPLILFELGEQLGRLFDLEKICREKAIRHLGGISSTQKLFMNVHPKTMADPKFTPGKTLELLERVGLGPENVVLEITEQQSLHHFSLFHKTLQHYRNQGFQIAVDDAGAGYSGLSTIAQLQPDFIKLDKSLITDIHNDHVKQALVETTTIFADKIGSRIIAEGIETRDQAMCLLEMGVHCGQGYFLGKPSPIREELNSNCIELRSVASISRKTASCSIPIGDLADVPHAVDSDFRVSEALKLFRNNSKFDCIVVTECNVPVGLVMEYELNRELSSQYGVALYYNRPLARVMDHAPLITDFDTPVEQAARMAMDRPSSKAYDDIIITRKGRLYGIVSVQKLLNTLAKVQLEMAKGTNPLTGLPGNVSIEREVERRLAVGESFSIIYADLDHFKVYNDTYGFKNGDRIIKLAADIMSWATEKYGPKDAMLCHIGGDDFVILTSDDSAERTCLSIKRCFQRLVSNCYSEQDQERGWIRAMGRDGRERHFPLVSISLGIISIGGRCTLMQIGERAAHIKKYAKSIPGNSIARDRRPALGTGKGKRTEHDKMHRPR